MPLYSNPSIFTSVAPGLVPASGGGSTVFLNADGSFAAPASGGTQGGVTQAPPQAGRGGQVDVREAVSVGDPGGNGVVRVGSGATATTFGSVEPLGAMVRGS